MAEPIDPVLAGKLDAYWVPALPPGFPERLVAAALAEPAELADGLPKLRRSAKRRWLRGGLTGLGVVAVGMVSISAAAMGYFGEPIRHAVQQAPVVGKVIERVLPKSLHRAKPLTAPRVAKPEVAPIEPPVISAPVADAMPLQRLTPFERRQLRRAMLADPEARRNWLAAHPKAAERIAQRRAEMRRRRAEAGLGPQARMPVGDGMPQRFRREVLTPMERQQRIERLRERRQMMRERRRMLREQGDTEVRPEP